MNKFFPLLILLGTLTASGSAAASDTLRCGNRLVSVGDTKPEVLIKCGEPAWKDDWSDALISGVDSAVEQRISVVRERWVYNFGPNAFLEFLSFDNGRLTAISSGGYGYSEGRGAGRSCDQEKLQTGLSQYEVLQRCGEPFFRDSRREQRLTTVEHGTSRLLDLRVDEWTYNFGPNQFLRILTFENGRLVNVHTGDRGF
jgi:hypothetical protein